MTGNSPNVLYVSSGNTNNIIKFDTDGNLLGEVTHPDLPAPQGIAFDERGHFFSSSFSGDTIVEFDENDAYVQTITGDELDVPRSIAFVPITIEAVPAASWWGLGVMVILLITAGTLVMSRRL